MNDFLAAYSKLQNYSLRGINSSSTGLLFESFHIPAQESSIKELACIALSNMPSNAVDSDTSFLYNHCIIRLAEAFQKSSHPDIKRCITNAIKMVAIAGKDKTLLNEEDTMASLLENVCKKRDFDYFGTSLAFDWLESLARPCVIPDLWIHFRFHCPNADLRVHAIRVMSRFPEEFIQVMRACVQVDEIFSVISFDEFSILVGEMAYCCPTKIENIEWIFAVSKHAMELNPKDGAVAAFVCGLVLKHRFLFPEVVSPSFLIDF
jgi:hypothetical protein